MFVKEIFDKNIWDEFVLNQYHYTFLNSWSWGDFNEKMGDKVWRLGIFDSDILRGVALVVKISARRGKFLFCPHCPLFFGDKAECLNALVNYLKDLAIQEKCSFIRMSPIFDENEENKELFKDAGFRSAPIHMHVEVAWILDVELSEEKLLADMRKTTRYLIKKSEKDGVGIIEGKTEKDIEDFYDLYKKTTERQHFIPFSLKYLKNEFLAFEKDGGVSVFFAKYNGEIISGAIIIFYGDSAFYHHGASLLKYQKIPAAYLLQWEIIKETRKKGLKYYNFWGIAPTDDLKHPWYGLSLFKKGFGGFRRDYLHAQDLVLNRKYWFNYLIETARRKKRGV